MGKNSRAKLPWVLSTWVMSSYNHLTPIYSEDIKMLFGLKKCGGMVIKGGKVAMTNKVNLSSGRIADIQTAYNYLVIPQSHGNFYEEAKKAAASKYHQRARHIIAQWGNPCHKYLLPSIR
ncbi:unnamed protein product [Dracunculus medinensis]|uniref:Ald_Xan_dh_C2 domain-containing protein n=1 Tax=Dracunculus medinensis TaxID=318479 RepID=A0A0N4U3W3_DRAME|nr:unnamed protein product [Dracunculus medinensis]